MFKRHNYFFLNKRRISKYGHLTYDKETIEQQEKQGFFFEVDYTGSTRYPHGIKCVLTSTT